MRRGFLQRAQRRCEETRNKGGRPSSDRPSTGSTLSASASRIDPRPHSVFFQTSDGSFPAEETIHGTISLLPWGGLPGGCDTLFVSFRRNLELLQGHPYSDRALTAECAERNACVIAVHPVSGKGLGVLARRNVATGEVIVSEPLIVLPTTIRHDVLAQFDTLLGHMTSERRAAFVALHNCRASDKPGVPNCFGIHETNSFEFPFSGLVGGHAATYALMSRVNHSCVPNTDITLDPDTLLAELRALRPIHAGDELSISYLSSGDLLLPVSARRTQLWEDYSFHCACAACESAAMSMHAQLKQRGAV